MIKVIQDRITEMVENETIRAKMLEMKRSGATADQVRAWLINAAICTLIGA